MKRWAAIVFLLALMVAGCGRGENGLESAEEETRLSSVWANLKCFRSLLQLYRAQHADQWPQDFAQLTNFTDVTGTISAVYSAKHRFGPYLMRVPRNPWTENNGIEIVRGAETVYKPAPDMSRGWWYNRDTGEIRVHLPDWVVTPDGQRVNAM